MSNGPKLSRDWSGLRVKLLRDAECGMAKLPEGTEGVVHSFNRGRQGLWIITDQCSHCGVAVHISGLRPSDVEILTPHDQWKDTRVQKKARKATRGERQP